MFYSSTEERIRSKSYYSAKGAGDIEPLIEPVAILHGAQ
jgi:hypothetical protein